MPFLALSFHDSLTSSNWKCSFTITSSTPVLGVYFRPNRPMPVDGTKRSVLKVCFMNVWSTAGSTACGTGALVSPVVGGAFVGCTVGPFCGSCGVGVVGRGGALVPGLTPLTHGVCGVGEVGRGGAFLPGLTPSTHRRTTGAADSWAACSYWSSSSERDVEECSSSSGSSVSLWS